MSKEFKTRLTLITKESPEGIKGLDGEFSAIVDGQDNLVALVPNDYLEFVFEALDS